MFKTIEELEIDNNELIEVPVMEMELDAEALERRTFEDKSDEADIRQKKLL